MKKRFQLLLLSAAFAWLLTASAMVFADEKPAPPPGSEPTATDRDDSKLRRLDEPPAAPEAATETDDADVAAPDAEAAVEAPKAPAPENKPAHRHGSHNKQNERVTFAGNSTLPAGQTAETVVSIFGSSTSDGDVGEAIVSIMGNTRVNSGTVGDAAVAVVGNAHVNGHVHGDVVAVLGNVELGPNAIVDGQVVCVGGELTRDPAAVVHGGVQNVSILAHFGGFEWLHAWVEHCFLYARPLAFAPHLGWAWMIAFTMLGIYALLSVLAPDALKRCVKTLEERPGYSLLAAVLVTLLAPIAAILLIITIVGTPALALFLVGAGIFGKAVLLAWIGWRLLGLVRKDAESAVHPALAVLVGGVLVTLLYTVPILGFVLSKLLAWLGLGVVVYTIILAMKREKPPAAPAPTAAVLPSTPTPVFPAAVPTPAATLPTTVGLVTEPAATTAAGAPAPESVPPPVTAAAAVPPPPVPPAPPVISALTLPRAGFWIRILASALDAVLIGLVMGLLPHAIRPDYALLFGAYCAVMWSLKATTVGGIVCGLKVVRLDDRPVDWMTGVVRALGGFLSLVVAGIGFIWVAFDDQKQSWHDKIAGTTIVCVPKGVSLV